MFGVLVGAMLLNTLSTGLALDEKGEAMVKKYIETLSGASSLTVELQAIEGGMSVSRAAMVLAKPDYARFDTSGRIRIFKGEDFWDCFTAKNQFYTRQAKQEEMLEILNSDIFMAWGPLLSKDLLKLAKTAVYDGTDKIDQQEFQCVKLTVDPKVDKTARLYIDPNDGLAKHVEIVTGKGSKAETLLVLTDKFEIDTVGDSEVAFAMPSSAKEVAEDELVGTRWYYDLYEALDVAAKTGKIVLAHFTADWCGPCRTLEKNVFSSAEFRALSKRFVLAKVNIDKGKGRDYAEAYGISAVPTIKFLDSEGNVIHEVVGAVPKAQFLREMRTALGE
jgi:thiol-disulfide isomerase/thioredoxin